jgi:predicted house-cleaning noncanonical NTP pyrophosphatase (MazG superfamily)
MKKDNIEYIEYKKLVRDEVPNIIEKTGKKLVCYEIPQADFENEVILELQRQSGEYLQYKSKVELADILELFNVLLELRSYTFSEIDDIRQKKLMEKGGFERRIFLVEAEK